jgi:hypothetical protein
MIAAIHRGRAAGRPFGLLGRALGRHLKVSFGGRRIRRKWGKPLLPLQEAGMKWFEFIPE